MGPRSPASGPHEGGRVVAAGAPLDRARAAMIMVHGRGATAADILTVAAELDAPDIAFLAPQAAGGTWYPYSFLAPMADNEPGLSSGLQVIGDLLAAIAAAGTPPERTFLLGFSQGACLTLEFVARHARRYAGVAGLSGGLIGPSGTPREYTGALDGTPVFMGCSDVDFHIPKERVEESAAVLERLGGAVTMRLYRGMGHTVNADEIRAVQAMLGAVTNRADGG
ncbi:MAG TPA: phospholipase [Chloroflexia bacterium]|nr:phospholipase [Chloroflexia bacterium]